MKTVDDIFEQIQGTGLYHKRLLYYLLTPIFFVTPFVFLNQIFVLHIPDHWCDPPSGLTPAELNLNLEEWKDLMLPKVLGPDYQMRWSQCHMYNVQNQTLESILRDKNLTGMPQISCEEVNGYQYDKSEMIATAVSDNDWVCSRQNYATNLYTIGVAGLIVGSGLLSALADFKGRKYSFFISTLLVIICSIAPIWFSHSYLWYCIFKALSFACMMPLFQSPMNITTEISTSKMRGYVIGIACISWSLGNCALPLLAWLVNWWTTLRILCVAPLCFIFFYYEMLPESPRWLISKGRTDEALVIIKRIAKIN
ncbi:carcinine transporter-like [Tigriopus californicus]|uniref:carcinine transporter-like n=1 Tax=Tigriopus californicus TaxID=6832 RepID=UPI0027D9DDDB|nr:carcinine transporter-like [Tigriopus californicus]